MEGVVGRQVDPKAHPYPSYLLPGPAGKPGLASRPACRSGRRVCVRRSPVGAPGWHLGTVPASDRSYSRGYGLGYPDRVVVGRDGPDEVVALYGRVLVPGMALDWSMRVELDRTPDPWTRQPYSRRIEETPHAGPLPRPPQRSISRIRSFIAVIMVSNAAPRL
jgi:hypothetical protein